MAESRSSCFTFEQPKSARFSHLSIEDIPSEHVIYPILSFSVEWDPEHGATVRYHDDKFEWCET